MEHDALRILSRAGDAMPWVLKRGDERWEGIPPGRATTNSPELLMRMALNGAGITVVTDHFALPNLQRGDLVQVLPDWHLPPVSAWAVFPGRRLMPARTRVFLHALSEKFTGPECQGIEANVQQTKARLRQRRSAPAAVNLREETSEPATHSSSRRPSR
jgi:DNA-binding transcriptional LysR family regulator